MSKARNAQLVGQVMVHKSLGQVEVTGTVPGSFTKVEIRVIQRAEGWDDTIQAYRAVRRVTLNWEGGATINWKRNQRDQYGHEDVVHVNELQTLKS